MTKQDIDLIVQGLVEVVGTNNLKDILEYLDIKLITHSNTTEYVNHNGKQIIYISETIPEQLHDFVLAHEIGHAVLHDREIIQYSKLTIHKTQTEKEADYFAFKLLGKQIDPIYQYTAQQYAKLLQVNEDIIQYIIQDN